MRVCVCERERKKIIKKKQKKKKDKRTKEQKNKRTKKRELEHKMDEIHESKRGKCSSAQAAKNRTRKFVVKWSFKIRCAE